MSGEVEKCPILHVRPKFDVFTLYQFKRFKLQNCTVIYLNYNINKGFIQNTKTPKHYSVFLNALQSFIKLYPNPCPHNTAECLLKGK